MKTMNEHIKELGYEFEEIARNIVLIKDFLQEKETEELWEIINNATQKDWEEDYHKSQVELAKRMYNTEDLELAISKGFMEYTHSWTDKAISIPLEKSKDLNRRIAKLFEFDKNLWYGYIDTIQRQYFGANLTQHVDSDGDPDILYAVIGYLNDDYKDGELFFPKLNLEVKPPKNSIIIFPDGKDYEHGVKAPGDGPIRYALPTFVRSIKNAGNSLPE